LLADVYIEMMGGAQEGLVFESAAKDQIVQSAAILENKSMQNNNEIRKAIASRRFELSNEELSSHKDFIKKNFKENFWGY